MSSRILKPAHALLAAALLALSPAVAADDGSSGYSEAKLASFMVARAEVREIQAEYTSRMQETTDNEEVAKLQTEAQRKMVEAVQAEELTVDEFNDIARKANNDPELNEKLQQLAE